MPQNTFQLKEKAPQHYWKEQRRKMKSKRVCLFRVFPKNFNDINLLSKGSGTLIHTEDDEDYVDNYDLILQRPSQSRSLKSGAKTSPLGWIVDNWVVSNSK